MATATRRPPRRRFPGAQGDVVRGVEYRTSAFTHIGPAPAQGRARCPSAILRRAAAADLTDCDDQGAYYDFGLDLYIEGAQALLRRLKRASA
jgi:hypothetical protein